MPDVVKWSRCAILIINLIRLANPATRAKTRCQEVAPKPGDGFQCGDLAKLRIPGDPAYPMADIQKVSSVKECAVLCSRRIYDESEYQTGSSFGYRPFNLNTWCQSFFYDTEEHICQLGIKRVGNATKPSKESNLVFYDHGCFDCGDFCSNQAYGEQLLDNADFEAKLFGPWLTDRTQPASGHGSPRACRVRYNGLLYQSANMCQEQVYSLTFDYLFSGPNIHTTQHYLSALFGTGTNRSSFRTDIVGPNTTSWFQGRVYRKVDGEHSGPEFQFGGSGTNPSSNSNNSAIIDNVVLSRVPEPKPKKSAQSVFANGGFETGSLAPWQEIKGSPPSTGIVKVIKPGLSGSDYAVRLRFKNDTPSFTQLTQTLATSPNTIYLFSVDISLKQQLSYPWNVIFKFGPASYLTTHQYSFGTKGNRTISIPVFAGTQSTDFNLFAQTNLFGEPREIIFDDFRFVEIERNEFY